MKRNKYSAFTWYHKVIIDLYKHCSKSTVSVLQGNNRFKTWSAKTWSRGISEL